MGGRREEDGGRGGRKRKRVKKGDWKKKIRKNKWTKQRNINHNYSNIINMKFYI